MVSVQIMLLPLQIRPFWKIPSLLSLPADVRWGSFVRNECVTNEPQRTSAGRLQFARVSGCCYGYWDNFGNWCILLIALNNEF